jgi:transposase InsO family protein
VVDDSRWEHNRNRGPPRPQTTSNNADIVRQIAILEKQGIIEKSNAVYYSQVLMVPKPDGSRRLCVDYRSLNLCTPDPSWPLHDIHESFNRIGVQKPKIFGLMDFTQGFHQAPLTLATRVYTAFIVFCGVYQFTRLPFGLKKAPSYFQQTIATVVLAGLLYFTCEVYIDDVNVFGKDAGQFLARLREVFERFRHHKVYLKASKCYLGYSELNYLGKVISSEGLKMSQQRIQQVVDFPTPTISKHLKSFLGIANYFRDHVRNHSMVVKPLHMLLSNYCKTKKVTWTVEALNAFQQIKKEILKCTTMHFLTDNDPIYLHTDASDYGIGGYLFQLIDGKEVPIAFVSKSFTLVQLRWAVIQKEAFAIYYCCIFLKTLLRDRTFTIRTDHRNLLFIHENSNPMIVRWFMALSEYSYEIEFISGVDNGIADSMSRLCRNNMTDSPAEYSKSEILSSTIIPKFKLTDYQYKTISSLHNSNVGHFGLERTMKRLQDVNKRWEFQRQHVRWFIDHCPLCQKMSMLKIPIHAHGFSTSTYTPMECLNVDFIGPFPDGGYIFVIVDTFTRWVELFHTVDATALSAAKCLFQHFGRFGAPCQLRSDNGPHFVADLITEFLALVGVQHCLTLAYSKEENAIVERMNKEINRHLRALTYDNLSLENYKDSLPFVQRIINSNYSDRLKISAADLLFGKVLSLDRGIFLPSNEQMQSAKPLSSYASKMLKMQNNLLNASAKELLRTDLLHQASTSIFEHKEFLPDSYVLVHHRTGVPPTRLHTFWRGPMRVVSGNNSRYKLYDLVTHKETTFHTSDMKPFLFDPALTDPLDVARRDHMEFFVEAILDHRGNIRRKSTLEFYVKWLNYPDNENSWTPYSHLRDTDQLHEYLRSKNLQRLIPKKFL